MVFKKQATGQFGRFVISQLLIVSYKCFELNEVLKIKCSDSYCRILEEEDAVEILSQVRLENNFLPDTVILAKYVLFIFTSTVTACDLIFLFYF